MMHMGNIQRMKHWMSSFKHHERPAPGSIMAVRMDAPPGQVAVFAFMGYEPEVITNPSQIVDVEVTLRKRTKDAGNG